MTEKTVAYLPVPPKKIACGFYHTGAIANHKPSETTSIVPAAYVWGRNKYQTLGVVKPPVRGRVSESNDKDAEQAVFAPYPVEKINGKGPVYEIAAGTNHTVFLLKQPDEPGGEIYSVGLGTRGRLGCKNPDVGEDEEIEDVWFAKHPLQPKFSRLYPDKRLQVLRVVCGADHTICFATDGWLYAWGANGQGQCGVDQEGDVQWPTQVKILDPSGQLNHFAAGAQHSLAAYDKDLYSWGSNRNGRLGLGPSDFQKVPTFVDAIADYQIVYVACGEAHSGCCDEEGVAFTWGAGSYGRLGHGEDADVFVPKEATTFATLGPSQSRVPIKSMALGGFHSLFLQNGKNAKLYSCGSGAAVGLLADGDNSVILVPMCVSGSKVFPQNQQITQIACGMFHSLVLMSNGELIIWGVGSSGRLGVGDGRSKNICEPSAIRTEQFRGFDSDKKSGPQGVALIDPSEQRARRELRKTAGSTNKAGKGKQSWDVKQIALGSLHSMVLTDGGNMYMWGCNANGQLGLGVPTNHYQWIPKQLFIDKKRVVSEIAAGYDYCLALTTMHELWVWGKGTSGQLGTGYARDEPQPRRLESLLKVGLVVAIGAGEEHSGCVLRRDRVEHKLYMWGSAEGGMLGLGEGNISGIHSNPQLVELPELEHGKMQKSNGSLPLGPLSVTCGQNHTAVMVGSTEQLFLKPGQKDPRDYKNGLLTFGSGWYGKLGLDDESCNNAYSPAFVVMPPTVSANMVSLGAYHSAMLSADNDLWLWGKAKLCCEPAAQSHVLAPKRFNQIEGQPKIKMVACGELYTLAVTLETNELWVWGENKNGQLGLGPQAPPELQMPDQARMSPGPIDFVATGTAHTIAKFMTGDLFGWGNQSCGRLGLAEKKLDKICFDPEKVNAVWASIEAMSKDQDQHQVHVDSSSEDERDAKEDEKVAKTADTEKDDDSKAKMINKQKITQFSTMQVLIKQEELKCREDALRESRAKLQKRFEAIVAHIKDLPKMERELDEIIGDIEQSVKGNMKWLPKVNTLGAGDTKGDARVTATLPIYKELLFVIQQQVSYLGQLSMCFQNAAGEEAELFYRVVSCVFGEEHQRTQHLFLMLLRIMMDKETEISGQKMDDVFAIERSRAFHVFSRYSLSEVHYKDVIHLFLQDTRQKGRPQEGGNDSLLVEVANTSRKNEYFALDIHDFKRQQGEEDVGRGKQEENPDTLVNHQIYQERFKDFLMNTFVPLVCKVELPLDIRGLFAHALQAIKARQPHSDQNDAVNAAVPEELRVCNPLLRLFCIGILCPMLEEPTRYANKETYLAKSASMLKDDPQLFYNMSSIAGFLKLMVNNKFDPKDHKILINAAKHVKPSLLKYIQKQADVPNNLEVELMKDAYLYHFERARHPVCMSTSDLLRMSNMLKRHINKLRIKESDELEALCRQLPMWEENLIQEFASSPETDYQHNFLMNTRFLFEIDSSDLVICRATKCPMPSKLVGQSACVGLLQSFQGSEDSDNPRRALEALFRDLDPLEARTFQEMSAEFRARQGVYKQKSPPNYDMVQRLQDGLRMIEELVNVEAHPEDVLQFMADSLEKRRRFLKYLGEVRKAVEEIEAKKKKYEGTLNHMKKEYIQARDFSINLELDDKFNDWASPLQLTFTRISNTMKTKRLNSLDPQKMQELKCSILPIETYTVSKLRKLNIVADIHKDFAPLERRMNITIKALNEGGVEMVLYVVQGTNQNAVKRLYVTSEKISEMRRAEKTDKTGLSGPGEEDVFLTIFCSSFCALVTDLSKRASP